jgi:hypothetical protein
MTTTYSFLESYSASDVSLNNHQLSITGAPNVDFRKIENANGGLQASVTEVPAVWTITPSVGNNTFYQLVINQFVPAIGGTITHTLSYTSDSTATATEICDALRAELKLYTDLNIVGSGTTTLVLTAEAGSPLFTVTSSVGSLLGVVNTTPGVASKGKYADLVAKGFTGGVSGASYSTLKLDFLVTPPAEGVGGISFSSRTHYVFINEADGDYAAFSTKLGELLGALVPATTDANPEAVSVN